MKQYNKLLDCENKVLSAIHAIDALQPILLDRENREFLGTLHLNAKTLRDKLAKLIATLDQEFPA